MIDDDSVSLAENWASSAEEAEDYGRVISKGEYYKRHWNGIPHLYQKGNIIVSYIEKENDRKLAVDLNLIFDNETF